MISKGDIVYAKLKGVFWPAQVERVYTAKTPSGRRRTKFFVCYFECGSKARICQEAIKPWDEGPGDLELTSRRAKKFRVAYQEAMEAREQHQDEEAGSISPLSRVS